MKLIIVESPTKCLTIGKYLGSDYKVDASKGHVVELATCGKGGYGIEIDNKYKPIYKVMSEKYEIIKKLKKDAAEADEVILATDPDREGEAIAWHLCNVLKLDVSKTKRLEFHEITRESILHALENPRTINLNLVKAQEVRRIMDRIIGFSLSRLIKTKLINSSSAGRVQSATLKLIADHDREIDEFKPVEYWTLSLELENKGNVIKANYVPSKKDEKIKNKEENDAILSKLAKQAIVKDIKKTKRSIESKPAFSTSTLQQESFSVLHFPTARTASIAQQLYEGLKIGDENVGLITYIRTDNTSLSSSFVAKAKEYIEKNYGADYVGSLKVGKKAKGAQEAHEAIRPTSLYRTPDSIKGQVSDAQYKLYKLIYNRTLASLMKNKVENVSTVLFDCGGVTFKAEGSEVVFDGFSKLYAHSDEENASTLPSLAINKTLDVKKINNAQEFTKPPAFYNEAKVVKLMEDKGIGRPSTYASTIKTLFNRNYIHSINQALQSTDNGKLNAFVLNKYFPNLIDTKYTAEMEENLDKVQEGEVTYFDSIDKFYTDYMKEFDEASKKMYKTEKELVGRNCPECGSPLIYQVAKSGKFIGCSNFPKCQYTESINPIEEVGRNCPECGGPLIYKYKKKGKHSKFIGCSNYPKCQYTESIRTTTYTKKTHSTEKIVVKKCPDCGGDLVIRKSKTTFLGCTNFPKCRHKEPYKEEDIVKNEKK